MERHVNAIDGVITGCRPVFQKHNIRKAILFGSFATGRQTRRSDIDLILIQETGKRYFDRFEGILCDLHQRFRGRDIEVLIYPPTIRRTIIALLSGQQMDARELSQALGIKEKEVYEHLVHVARSVTAAGGRFIVTPSECLLCGYVFADRRRLTRPGRCPACRRSRLQSPSFRIA